MITIALNNKAKKIKKVLNRDPKAKWCYIGKDVAIREKIADILSREKRFYLKDRLHKIAEELRQPYLDFVAGLGKQQKDLLNWWASRFASKCNFQTDFFLLLCYKVLVSGLIRETAGKDRLVIFVENPWLFVEIKNENQKNASNKNIMFFGAPNIFVIKLFYFARGIIYRFLLIGWFVVAKLLMYYYHNDKGPKNLETKESAVCILNPAEKRAFKDGQYVDNYMPGLAEFYEKCGIPYFRLYYFPFNLSTARDVGKNKKILWPLIKDTKFSSLAKRIFEYWNPILNHDVLSDIKGYKTGFLLEREKSLEFASVGFNLKLILYDALNFFFSKKWCSSIIYLFENQPWEKMLCMSAQRNNVRAIGYQHSSIWRFFLSQFTGREESSLMPLPYKIVTAGSYFAQLYKEGGIPGEKIVVGGAWRFSQLLRSTQNNDSPKEDYNSKPIMLISLPICISISESMLNNIFNEISKNQLNKEAEFWIKLHPGILSLKLNIANKLTCKYRIVDKPFHELLKDADIVISSASTSGLEAFLYGKKVIFYLPENLILAGLLADIEEEGIYKWYEGDGFNIDFLRDFLSTSNSQDLQQLRNKYFAEINHDIWLELLKS